MRIGGIKNAQGPFQTYSIFGTQNKAANQPLPEPAITLPNLFHLSESNGDVNFSKKKFTTYPISSIKFYTSN